MSHTTILVLALSLPWLPAGMLVSWLPGLPQRRGSSRARCLALARSLESQIPLAEFVDARGVRCCRPARPEQLA